MKKTIHRECKTNYLTQGFYENSASYKNGRIVPYDPNLPSFYKERCGMNSHGGQDFLLWHGEPLYFGTDLDVDWEVKRWGHGDERGLRLVITSKEKLKVKHDGVKVWGLSELKEGEEGNYCKFTFGHLLETPLKNGDTIRKGSYLGRGNNSGYSIGDHLHKGFKECNKNGYALNWDNGWKGNLDISPICSGKYVMDTDKDLKEIKLNFTEQLKLGETALKVMLWKICQK